MNRRFPITDFGAAAQGGDATAALRQAVDACFRAGGGEVVLPEGTFVSGAIFLLSGVTLRLERGAVLRGDADCEAYQTEGSAADGSYGPLEPRPLSHRRDRWHRALINAFDAQDVAVIGEEGSLIDGADCVDPQGEEGFRGPHLMFFQNCSGLVLEGYTAERSANYAHLFEDCSDIRMTRVSVRGGHDGVHIQRCERVLVEGCDFRTGDDCVAGCDNDGVTVRDCSINTSCNGFRIGALDLLVSNCRLYGPGEYGHRISSRHNMLSAFVYFSAADRKVSREAGGWRIENCTVDDVGFLFLYNFSGDDPWQTAKPLHDVTFEKVRARGIANPISVFGDGEGVFSLMLKNLSFSFAGGQSGGQSDRPFLWLNRYGEAVVESCSVEGGPLLIEASAGGALSVAKAPAGETIIRRTDESRPWPGWRF